MDDKIECTSTNPKQLGSDSFKRYEEYKYARTVREALDRGAKTSDLEWDAERGFCIITRSTRSVASAFGSTAAPAKNQGKKRKPPATKPRRRCRRKLAAAAAATTKRGKKRKTTAPLSPHGEIRNKLGLGRTRSTPDIHKKHPKYKSPPGDHPVGPAGAKMYQRRKKANANTRRGDRKAENAKTNAKREDRTAENAKTNAKNNATQPA